MARLATLLSVPVRFGPVSAQSEYCTVLSQGQSTVRTTTAAFRPSQRIDDNMSSDLEWHLLRVRDTTFKPLLQLTLL
jgi:hypothetical protein